MLGQESEKTQHSKTSVVDFLDQSSGLGFLRLVLGEAERIVVVEWDWVWDGRSELGEGSWLSTLHVVWLVLTGGEGRSQLRVDFQKSNESQDLVLGFNRKSGPLLGRRKVGGWERSSIQSHGPGPVEVGLDAVSDEGEHGNTSVLDFGVTKEANGFFIASFPQIPGRKAKRIVVLDDGVQLSCQGFKVGLLKNKKMNCEPMKG